MEYTFKVIIEDKIELQMKIKVQGNGCEKVISLSSGSLEGQLWRKKDMYMF
jgi:hypothetical protein